MVSGGIETKTTYMAKGRNMQQATEMTTSTHHNVQARVTAHGPKAGTQTKTVILTIVASPYAERQRCKCKTRPRAPIILTIGHVPNRQVSLPSGKSKCSVLMEREDPHNAERLT